MTYLEFHLIFNLPLLLVLLWLGRRRMTGVHWKWVGVVCLIVLGFTFPWDNYAVEQGIWGFEDERILFRIASLPVEEVAFFLFETLVVILAAVHFLPEKQTEQGDGRH